MDLPPEIPQALNLADAHLQRLQFEEEQAVDPDRVMSVARYDVKTLSGEPVRVAVSASAHRDDRDDLRAVTAEIYAAFDVRELDSELSEFEPEEDEEQKKDYGAESAPEPALDRDILFEIDLVSPVDERSSGKVVSFLIDPVPISKNETPHRWKPTNASTVWVWMRIDAGDATMRVFQGSNPTDRFRRRDVPGWTKPLKADVDTPRVRVNGHRNGTSYDLSGGWALI
jgi:hypothetical protein